MSLTLYDCNVVQLTEYLPQSGPSKAPFIDPILRNGVEDVNLLNASIFYLEHRWKLSLPSASDFDHELCIEARSHWKTCVERNARLCRIHSEIPYKTSFQEAKGHTPVVIYSKDNGKRYPTEPFAYKYTNEFGQQSKVYGRVSSYTSITLLPYLDSNWNLICYDWQTERWENTKVQFGPNAWDVKPDGTFVHCEPPKRKRGAAVPPEGHHALLSEEEKLAADPETCSLIQSIGRRKYYEVLRHTPKRLVIDCDVSSIVWK